MREHIAVCSPAWVLMQYTHLMWSPSGFPLRALDVARTIRRMKTRLAVVIHDPIGFAGGRLIDRARRRAQHMTMRSLCRLADATMVTLAADRVPWCGRTLRARVRCIPVGPNIVPSDGDPGRHPTFTVSVFGVTAGRLAEVEDIAHVARHVASELDGLRLVVLGRGSRESEHSLRAFLDGSRVDLAVGGVLPAPDVSASLAGSDAMLFIRSGVSSRRGTAVAAVAHGLPIVGYEGSETAPPITEAGVVLRPRGDRAGLAQALIRLARDTQWAAGLRARSLAAYRRYFSWDRIGQAFEESLKWVP
jgi:glycosyltransferase involved in cell wall biosynthesis